MADLMTAIETDTQPMCNGRDNLWTMALIDAAYQSAAQHRAVDPAEIFEAKWDVRPDLKYRLQDTDFRAKMAKTGRTRASILLKLTFPPTHCRTPSGSLLICTARFLNQDDTCCSLPAPALAGWPRRD